MNVWVNRAKVLIDVMSRNEVAGLRESFSKTGISYFVPLHLKNTSYCLCQANNIVSC